MACLARLMRRVMVASGTRNARATSVVVNPPTARSVSAICDAGESAGWQHMNSRMSESSTSDVDASGAGASHCSGNAHWATVSSRRRRACSVRKGQSAARGDRDEPGARILRHPVARPLTGGRDQGLLDGVLGGVEVSVAPHQGAEGLRGEPPQQALDVVIGHRGLDVQVAAAFVDRSHIDHELPGASGGYGAFAKRAAISVARSKLSHSTIV